MTMLNSKSLVAVLTVALVSCAVSAQPGDAPDVQILNYALTLEHFENASYHEALSKFDDKTFSDAGLNRSLFEEVAGHESNHVDFLSKALGDQATKACNYSFPYTDVKSFTAFSMILEGAGVSAYLGAASRITNKGNLVAAGSILATEARHAAYLSSVSTNFQAPWNTAFETPLDFDQVYSLVAPFITSCPSSNPPLPLKAFPALNLTTPNYTPGSTLTFTENSTSNAGHNDDPQQQQQQQLYVAFLTGLGATYAPYNVSAKSVVVPESLSQIGTVYAVLTTTNTSNTPPTDDTTVAGPVVLLFPNNGTEGSANDSRTRKPVLGGGTNSAVGWVGGIPFGYTVFVALFIALVMQ